MEDSLAYGEYQCDLLPIVDDTLWFAHLVEGPCLFLLPPCPILPVPMALVQVDVMRVTQERAEVDQQRNGSESEDRETLYARGSSTANRGLRTIVQSGP